MLRARAWVSAGVIVAAWWIAALGSHAAPPSSGALYLVSGYADAEVDEYAPTRLFKLDLGTKKTTQLADLLPPSATSEFVRAYHDERLLMIATPHFRPTQLRLVDMDNPCSPIGHGLSAKPELLAEAAGFNAVYWAFTGSSCEGLGK